LSESATNEALDLNVKIQNLKLPSIGNINYLDKKYKKKNLPALDEKN